MTASWTLKLESPLACILQTGYGSISAQLWRSAVWTVLSSLGSRFPKLTVCKDTQRLVRQSAQRSSQMQPYEIFSRERIFGCSHLLTFRILESRFSASLMPSAALCNVTDEDQYCVRRCIS